MKNASFKSVFWSFSIWGVLFYFLASRAYMLMVQFETVVNSTNQCLLSEKCRENP